MWDNEKIVLPPIKNSHDNPTLMESKIIDSLNLHKKVGKIMKAKIEVMMKIYQVLLLFMQLEKHLELILRINKRNK